MIPELKKILYTTDLSDNARYAYRYAVSLANRYDARLTILHVLEAFSDNVRSSVSALIGQEKWEELQRRKESKAVEIIKQRIHEFCSQMHSEDSRCPFGPDDVVIRRGEAVNQILNEIKDGAYDVVILGSKGYGRVAEALMGSTARRILRRCTIPVLLVRLPEA